MAIYTKTGDKGQTALFGGKRLSKDSPQIEAYGTIDELTSFIGLIAVKVTDKQEQLFLEQTQKELYEIMGFLAGAKVPLAPLLERVSFFEQKIDEMEAKMPKLNRFIVPGGTEISAWFHIVRAVCRRAERAVVTFSQTAHTLDISSVEITLKYLNRLSDLFFDTARWYNKNTEVLV